MSMRLFFTLFVWQTAYRLICIDKFSVPSTRNTVGHEKTAFPAWALRFAQARLTAARCHVHFEQTDHHPVICIRISYNHLLPKK